MRKKAILPNVRKPAKKKKIVRERKSRRKAKRLRAPGKVTVFDEHGQVVYSGKDRRQYSEQVVFDSDEDIRRFTINPPKISKKRRKELEAVASAKNVLGRTTLPSTRNPKHYKKKQENG